MPLRSIFAAALLSLGFAVQPAQADTHVPFPPYRIAGNLYFVGNADEADYLITTPQGNILINSGYPDSPSQIRDSIEKLGFRYSDIKILLVSHAHADHVGGSAQIIRETGARYEVMDGDVSVVESGGRLDFNGYAPYPPAQVDRTLHNGDTVALGGTVLTAHKTPGHTKGCTAWTMQVQDGPRRLNVLIECSLGVNPGYKLVNNARYPNIAQDYEASFDTLRHLPVDIFLSSHGFFYRMKTKYSMRKASGGNPFIDPAGFRAYVAERETRFHTELARQQAGEEPCNSFEGFDHNGEYDERCAYKPR